MDINKVPLRQRLKPYFTVFDGPLALFVFLLLSTGMVTLYSAGIDFPGRFEGQMRNIVLAFFIMWIAANIPPQTLMRMAVPIYTFGVALLIAVAMFGVVKKGARRWLHLGVDMQPSEIMKIAMPLMMAWYFQYRGTLLNWKTFAFAGVLLAVPAALIAKQPDLGTAVQVTAAGFYVIFLAGLSWKALAGLGFAGLASLPIIWSHMHDFQRNRILTFLDPTHDPLGKGFHIIQSMIAIGSGGVSGKGWLQGTQAHLEFIPENTTDFIFSVYAEEFGLVGNLILVVLYALLIGRGMMIAGNAPNTFTRLLAGAITMMFFTLAFINMGMVSGLVPVVGVPLPFISYGGTALFTLGLAVGILMSIQRHRKLVQT